MRTQQPCSGGPVSRVSDLGEECTLGVLLEQFPDLATERRASNVLFAASMAGVFGAFVAFDYIDVSGEGSRRSRSEPEPEPEPDPDPSASGQGGGMMTFLTDTRDTLETARKKLAIADETLRWAKEWARDGLLDEMEYRQLKVRVREFVTPM